MDAKLFAVVTCQTEKLLHWELTNIEAHIWSPVIDIKTKNVEGRSMQRPKVQEWSNKTTPSNKQHAKYRNDDAKRYREKTKHEKKKEYIEVENSIRSMLQIMKIRSGWRWSDVTVP